MSTNPIAAWHRIEYEKTPIYIHPDGPDWFIPNSAADDRFITVLKNHATPPEIQNLIKRIRNPQETEYHSRAELLNLETLKECWIHITNRCNMTCGHCMFRSSPQADDELSETECLRIIREADDLGCRLFYFTGGEPLLSKAFFTGVETIYALPDTHVVLLTNLTLISKWKEWFNAFPKDRLHFQVSLDGLNGTHDAVRGPNTFQKLCENLEILKELGFAVTLAVTITHDTVDEMKNIVEFAAQRQIANLHFLWLFKKGNADDTLFVNPDRIFSNLKSAQLRAEQIGVKIDNVEMLRSQVFSSPGTRFDLSNAGWQSLAVGPDGNVYPTPALIYTPKMQCGHIGEGIEQVWKHSPVLERIRSASLNDSAAYSANTFRYLIGGGDIDQSYIHTGKLTGGDPYVDLYNNIAKWLMVREAENSNTNDHPAIKLKMGDQLGECPAEGGGIFFTHSNCVLSLPGFDAHTQVNRFYSEAAEETKEDILNPICYENTLIDHIPEEMRYRSYGCGSPVMEAAIKADETIVDLGSGTGIECFIAGKLAGRSGRVIGIDMGDTMLNIANTAKAQVAKNLRYDNLEFKKAFLEDLPLADEYADVVISNCVVNLSPNKRRVFQEIFRVLKPGGRLVISDITHDEDIPLDIRYNETLRGECIGGALRYQDLFGLLNDIGFSDSRIEKGYPYRTVKGYTFYSITYKAFKPIPNQSPVLYEFPDFHGLMAAVESEPTCACFTTPETIPQTPAPQKERSGCMVCGEDIVYSETDHDKTCRYCGQTVVTNAQCSNGHFVCDACHRTDAIEVIKQVCLHSREPDALALMEVIRSHPHFPIHGPEHHAMVPAVILTALRNNGNDISDEQIFSAIQRGQTIAGGACAFLGACGAALGVGIAFSIMTSANPTDGTKRQEVQQVTQKVLAKIASYDAPRCCQRDVWLALQTASELLQEKLGRTLQLNQPVSCRQFTQNKECIRAQCPLWPGIK